MYVRFIAAAGALTQNDKINGQLDTRWSQWAEEDLGKPQDQSKKLLLVYEDLWQAPL